jgi:hypothetical protein
VDRIVSWCEGCLVGQWANWILVRWFGYFVEHWVIRIVGWSVVRMVSGNLVGPLIGRSAVWLGLSICWSLAMAFDRLLVS